MMTALSRRAVIMVVLSLAPDAGDISGGLRMSTVWLASLHAICSVSYVDFGPC
jgi:hypothetical protein